MSERGETSDSGAFSSDGSMIESITAAMSGNMWLVVGGLLVPVAAGAAFALYMGAHRKMELATKETGPMQLVYFNTRSAMKNLAAVFAKSQAILREVPALADRDDLIPCGLYYDDPSAVKDPTACRVSAGFIVPAAVDLGGIADTLAAAGFEHASIPAGACIVGTWPFKNWMSWVMGASKFYTGAMRMKEVLGVGDGEEAQECHWASMEIYDDKKFLTTYMVPLERDKAFFLTDLPSPEYKVPKEKAPTADANLKPVDLNE